MNVYLNVGGGTSPNCDLQKNSYMLTYNHSQASTDQTNFQNCSIKSVYCTSGIDPSTNIIPSYYIIFKS